ncbi:hypothetical protein UB46_29900 [Burkholderiaceae bacterium 16]|nr:hypothetical protein UB46_29900 [Burkholderiaceae bacterium 16]
MRYPRSTSSTACFIPVPGAAAVVAAQRPTGRMAAAVIIAPWIGEAMVMATRLTRHTPWLGRN